MRFLLLYDKNGVLQTGQIRSICESRGIKAVFSAHHSWRHLSEQNFFALRCGGCEIFVWHCRQKRIFL